MPSFNFSASLCSNGSCVLMARKCSTVILNIWAIWCALELFLAEEGQAKAVVLQHLLHRCVVVLGAKIDQLQRNLLRALVFWAQSPHRVFNQAGQLLGQAGGQHLDRGAGAEVSTVAWALPVSSNWAYSTTAVCS